MSCEFRGVHERGIPPCTVYAGATSFYFLPRRACLSYVGHRVQRLTLFGDFTTLQNVVNWHAQHVARFFPQLFLSVFASLMMTLWCHLKENLSSWNETPHVQYISSMSSTARSVPVRHNFYIRLIAGPAVTLPPPYQPQGGIRREVKKCPQFSDCWSILFKGDF